MAQSLNQFSQSPVKGQMDLLVNYSTVSCLVDSSSAGGLVPGTAVKLVDNGTKVPSIVECAADTDGVFGFINYDIKSPSFEVGDMCEVSFFRGNVMWMEASAAISKGVQIEIVVSGQKVAAATSGKRIVGMALDKATAAADLIRVIIDLPGALA